MSETPASTPTLTVTWQGIVRTFRLDSDKPSRLGRHPASEVPFDPQRDLIVSSSHAKVVRVCGTWTLVDLESRNGVWLIEGGTGRRRVSRATLKGGEEFELGRSGPLVRFDRPQGEMGKTKKFGALPSNPLPQARRLPLGPKASFIGRDPMCEVHIDDSRVSRRHALVEPLGNGHVLRDLESRNGTFVNGERVEVRELASGDRILIGGRRVDYQPPHLVVQDAEVGAGLEARALTREHDGKLVLDDVWLAVSPGDLIAVMGPSGSGKTALLDALAGVRAADKGSVLIGGTSLYDCPESVRGWIGHVGAEPSLHEDRSVSSLLATAAALRLPEHTAAERRDRVERVLADVELTNHHNKRIGRLNAVQRRRIQMGVELIGEPAILCLDDPTGGLDPGEHYHLLRLAREIATLGRSVIVATSSVLHLDLFDQVAFLVDGKLTFYGRPGEALQHFECEGPADLFHACRGRDAAEWRDIYRASAACKRFLPGYVFDPTRVEEPGAGPVIEGGVKISAASGPVRVPRIVPRTRPEDMEGAPPGRFDWDSLGRSLRLLGAPGRTLSGREPPGGIREVVRQLGVLGKQDFERLADGRDDLLWLAAGAPLALGLAFGVAAPRLDSALLWLALGAWWLAAQRAAPELVRDRAAFRRDRRANMRIASYLLARFAPLALVASVQSLVLLAAVVHLAGLDVPLARAGGLLALAACTGTAAGLAVSAAARTGLTASLIAATLLLVQILFSGGFEGDSAPPPRGLVATADRLTPAYWAFDELKRMAIERGAPDRHAEERKVRELETRQDRLSGELGELARSWNAASLALAAGSATPGLAAARPQDQARERLGELARDFQHTLDARAAALASLRDAHRRRSAALAANHLGAPGAAFGWLAGLVLAGLGLAAGLLRWRELADEV